MQVEAPVTMVKPSAIVRAIGVLWAALLLWVSAVLVASPDLLRYNSSFYVAIIIIGTFGIYSFFIRKISEGKDWARIVYVVLFVQSTVRFIFSVPSDFGRYPVTSAIAIVGLGLEAFAVYLMFTAQGKVWFQPRSAHQPDPQITQSHANMQ